MDLNRPALNRASSRLRAGGGNLSSYAYAVNAIGQRQSVTTGGTAMAAPATSRWGYDGLGQLVAEDFGNNQAANPRDRGYAYDLIGNRKNSIQGVTDPLADGNLAYHANPLNQYDSIGAFQPVHDDDGNLTTGRLHSAAFGNVGGTPYTGTLHWNGENRLAKVEDGSAVKATYQYDFMGRRVRKQVGNTVTWYVYDGYNELGRFTQTGTVAPAIQRTFTWGLDISNTPQGAGGVGGLLSVKVHGTTSATYFPTYDANGNISEYLASNGSVAAHFEYDGFGNTVVNTDTTSLFDYRFSTKPLEDVTGLYYYLYRYYDPVAGRWPSRDTIGERGGVNLYGFVLDDPTNLIDIFGWKPSCGNIDQVGYDAAREASDRTQEHPDKVEFCGTLCCKNGVTRKTGPIEGKSGSCDPAKAPCNSDEKEVGVYHSHPTNSDFSDADYLATPYEGSNYLGRPDGVRRIDKNNVGGGITRPSTCRVNRDGVEIPYPPENNAIRERMGLPPLNNTTGPKR